MRKARSGKFGTRFLRHARLDSSDQLDLGGFVIGRRLSVSCTLLYSTVRAPSAIEQQSAISATEKMFSLRSLPARTGKNSICAQCLRLNRTSTRSVSLLCTNATRPATQPQSVRKPHSSLLLPSPRKFATKSTADELIEDIQDQYATARDEFEIATEETEKKTVYAADDRAAARQELDKLKEMFQEALAGSDGEEVQRRIGQRIRELDNAVQGLEKAALEE